MSYIGTEPKDIRSFGRTKFDYTATQGQTAFTGADDDGKVLAFTVGQIEVYVNGILMDDSDFTTTGTGTVTLVSAANLNDVINIVSFETNIPDSNYVPASGGTFTGNITASGTLGVTGAVTASNGLTVDDDGATVLTVDRATNDGTIIDVQKDGTSVGNIGANGSRAYMSGPQKGIKFGNVSVDPCTNTGATADNAYDLGGSSVRFKDLYLGGGVYLGGTGASNKLDDYEEGTWTLSASNSNVTLNSAYGVSKYTKIGNVVNFQAYIRVSAVSGTDTFMLNLPFTSAASPSNGNAAWSGAVMNEFVDSEVLMWFIPPNTSSDGLRFYRNFTSTSTWDQLRNNDLASNSAMYVSGFYHTA